MNYTILSLFFILCALGTMAVKCLSNKKDPDTFIVDYLRRDKDGKLQLKVNMYIYPDSKFPQSSDIGISAEDIIMVRKLEKNEVKDVL